MASTQSLYNSSKSCWQGEKWRWWDSVEAWRKESYDFCCRLIGSNLRPHKLSHPVSLSYLPLF